MYVLIEQEKDGDDGTEFFFTTKIDATDIHLKVSKILCVCLLAFMFPLNHEE